VLCQAAAKAEKNSGIEGYMQVAEMADPFTWRVQCDGKDNGATEEKICS
jgi:hypothetical protein